MICRWLTTADTYVQAGAPSEPASAVSAWPAALTAAREMASGSSPRSAPSASGVIPAFTAVQDASSGRGADDTPSQTIATTTGPALVSATAKCIASSFRECRSPRSLTPATWPRSSSMWSRSATTRLPQDGQYPSSPATTGSSESVEHAVHIFAAGELLRDALIRIPAPVRLAIFRSPGH